MLSSNQINNRLTQFYLVETELPRFLSGSYALRGNLHAAFHFFLNVIACTMKAAKEVQDGKN
jgi:hypothetical protein